MSTQGGWYKDANNDLYMVTNFVMDKEIVTIIDEVIGDEISIDLKRETALFRYLLMILAM